MKKKIIVLASSLIVVSLLFIGITQKAYASCECISGAGAGTEKDSSGNVIPREAYGTWQNTPVAAPTDPKCAALAVCGDPSCGNAAGTYLGGSGCPICETKSCNVYTQGYVKTWFKVPTLGDLIGNIIRLMFFIAGLYALVLLLLGGFEWVSSGGDDKKLTSARGKIFNAIIGLVVMVAVLTLVIILEQVVFGGKVCLGISCPINMGDLSLIK